MNKAQKGFTLIELVVVITILGILAAFAFPRFASLEVEARAATVDGFGGSLRAGTALAHSLDLVGAAVSMEGNVITMAFGYPAGDVGGIDATLSDTSGFTRTDDAADPMTVTFTRDGGPGAATCGVTYLEAIANGAPTITINSGTC